MLKRLLLVLVPVLGIAAWLMVRDTEAPEVPFATATRDTLVSTLTTNGKVEPIEWATVRAQTGGPVASINVKRGEFVKQGQLLVTINADEARSQAAVAKSKIDQARAEIETLERGGRTTELAEIESGLAKAKADLENARREYDVLQRLVQKKAATPEQASAAKQLVEQSELQIQSLERRRKSLVSAPDKSAAQARLEEAQTGATAASQRIADAQIRAPISGVVYAFELRPGAFLTPGEEVARVGKLSELRVVVYVDEPELGRVEKGMPVTITWDALPGRQWTGHVESVPLQVVSLGTRQVGEVLCTIQNPDQSLIPGTNVNVGIRSSVVPDALTIPKEALRREGNETGVLVLRGDRAVWQGVKLGAASVTRVQVLEGVAQGDKVALPSGSSVASGDKVQPVLRDKGA